MNKRLIFVFIILIVDFIYVYNSQSVYNNIFDKDNAKKITLNRKLIGAISAYTFMGIGWYFLVATKIEKLLQEKAGVPLLIGAWCGFLYAALVFGVYNFTMFASIENWSGNIIIRDLSWGFISSIVASSIYALWYSQKY